jgi:septal ring factor EnvC (AmiA/AmiB activator)
MTSEENSLTGWMLAGIASVIATLTSTVAWLFKLRENENAKRLSELKSDVETINAKADKCEVEREGLKVECAVMRSKIETLEVKLERINVNGTDYSHKKQS